MGWRLLKVAGTTKDNVDEILTCYNFMKTAGNKKSFVAESNAHNFPMKNSLPWLGEKDKLEFIKIRCKSSWEIKVYARRFWP